jgi:hypothetical protein
MIAFIHKLFYHSARNILSFSILYNNIKFKIQRTAFLVLVLYWCEIWPLTLREAHRLGVYKKRVLRKIFGPKRGEVTGYWRKFRNKELYYTYSSPNIITVIK